ncbi:MAG: hypothetical protein HZA30_00975 [Candidatus Omnitrophica bacterium]|nr:hypothetical protein [Candidatus Omnitrophota bacterium]
MKIRDFLNQGLFNVFDSKIFSDEKTDKPIKANKAKKSLLMLKERVMYINDKRIKLTSNSAFPTRRKISYFVNLIKSVYNPRLKNEAPTINIIIKGNHL